MNQKTLYPKWKMLTAWRERRGLSAPQLAERIGTKHQYIYRLERGQQKATDVWGQKLAAALDVMVDELLPTSDAAIAEIMYTAEAGLFLENPLHSPVNQIPVQLPQDRRYPAGARFIVRSSGVGHELRYPEDTLIVCATLDAVGQKLTPDVWYAIQHTVNNLHEIAVRKFNKNGKGTFVLPTDAKRFEIEIGHGPSVKILGRAIQRIINE